MTTKLDALVRQLASGSESAKAKSTIVVDAEVAKAFRAAAKSLGYRTPTKFIESLLIHYLETNGKRSVKDYLEGRKKASAATSKTARSSLRPRD